MTGCRGCPAGFGCLQTLAEVVPDCWLGTQYRLAAALTEVNKAILGLRWANLLCPLDKGSYVQ